MFVVLQVGVRLPNEEATPWRRPECSPLASSNHSASVWSGKVSVVLLSLFMKPLCPCTGHNGSQTFKEVEVMPNLTLGGEGSAVCLRSWGTGRGHSVVTVL